MPKRHFTLSNLIAEAKDYIPQNHNFGKNTLPERNRISHAEYLMNLYNAAIDKSLELQNARIREGLPVADGCYLNMEIDRKLIPGNIDSITGTHLMKISDVDPEGNVDVTVFIRNEKRDWFTKRADEYKLADTPKGPKNEKLIAPINSITNADIHSLYESATAFDALESRENLLFELWVSKRNGYSVDIVESTLTKLNVDCNVTKRLQFDNVDVFLIKACKEQLEELPSALADIEGVRRYQQPSLLTRTNGERREWNTLLQNVIDYNITDNSLRVGILDTGVNNVHSLISPALPDELMKTAINVQDTIDHSFHGTNMAGLVLAGDLTELAYRRGSNLEINHGLVSVKIFEDGHSSDEMFYGAIIEDAINQAQEMGAQIDCMAITDSDSYDGSPTSSSAALDESIYNQGNCDRLVIVSAGNIQPADIDVSNYMESCKANAIKSPAQAWNALTVGAYTQKTITANDSSTRFPLAAPGGVSPFSTTSYPWKNGHIKPEIMMEGGNMVDGHILGALTDPDLSVISPCQELNSPLEAFYATSAATALAARLAERIKEENPHLSALSIRALMVHSARWTEEMRRLGFVKDIMPLCGYGVPNEQKAIYSDDRYATYIFENELIPFTSENGNTKYHQLHYFDLPWPSELLEKMCDENVTMRVTLSYYVKPAPGNASRLNKYRYPSGTLRFDVKSATESENEFLRRHNKNEGEYSSTNDPGRWEVGIQRRENSTIQSDWFTCTAQQLAECGKIVVYPGPGWWKERRRLDNVDNVIKYSLIVSIESSETEIYQAIKTAIDNRITTQITNG